MKKGYLKDYFLYSLMGLCMGVVLARVGFADYDELHHMFIFADTRMFFSFAGGTLLAMVVFLAFYKKFPRQKKLLQPGTVPGSVMFGFGWAICGACPSIVFVQLGQGKLPALMTLLGIFIGVAIYRRIHARYFQWDVGSCST